MEESQMSESEDWESKYKELEKQVTNINEKLSNINPVNVTPMNIDPRQNVELYDSVRKRNAELFGQNPNGFMQTNPETAKQIKYLTDTTRTSTGAATLLPEIWSKKIIYDAAAERVFEPWAYVDKTLVTQAGDVVNMPVETNLTSMTNNNTEGGATTYTEEDSLAATAFTPVTYRYAVNLSYELVKQSAVNRMLQAKRQLTQYGTDSVDSGIGTACVNAGASVADILYGGDAAGADELATGDIITTNLFANAIQAIKANKWKNERGPRQFCCFIGTEQENVFLKDSQFVNASEYGSGRIVTTGEIGEYLGVKVNVANNIPTKAASAADWTEGVNWGAAGNGCIFAKGQVSFGIAYAEMPSIKYDFDYDENEHRFWHYSIWQAGSLQADSICLVKVTNA